jgi:S1-C subfamily serine protease
MGIVSAKGRATGLGDGSFEDFIQTDAPINRGNSGGALVNTRGELIGINSQILSPSGGNIGIGFAIPAEMATNVMEALVADGRVRRGMLGVTVQPLTADLARSLGLPAARGALVSSVREDGPADDAGLERGDVVTAIGGEPVGDSNDLRNRIAAARPGARVALTVMRDGKERTIAATLDELPSADTPAGTGEAAPNDGALGLQLREVPAERARALGLKDGAGLLVAGVRPGSPAADAGFRAGDVIEEAGGAAVTGVAALRQAVNGAGDRPVLVLVRRGDQPLYLTLGPSRS